MKNIIRLTGYFVIVLFITILITALFFFAINFFQFSDLAENNFNKIINPTNNIPTTSINKLQPTNISLELDISPKPKTVKKTVPKENTDPWGVAKKIGDHTYTIKLGHDNAMGSPNEIYEALNNYRNQMNKGYLSWDEKLAQYAQKRADYFKSINSTDEHAELNDYLDNRNGFVELSFNKVGENSYYGTPLYGVHVIEWLFASSSEHNSNQLDNSWSHVGIGSNGFSVDIIFGGGKM
ncbi:hypothetical protein A3C23_05265 [Candidatus Roizmanbacteria bacterium RIFCSPHIGHO2_02_FULL_37_13b]|uniref:SCP domain-containing protein n=1 Tax=Candidatus Roizmanbacteria bacterium RIFCSPLOWO2_02_FULL_36_11 TaxID=1802071 RepID=A0A1F7JCM2_9BACT|nr:MAG: hypothetical protein A3C23_05265 [Candidatus Roizmanbacteria bacterium RIFCSPHIGHO2_02_FULL_37_13b]OGK53347.1 MAG: hypothetical protein A3H78_03525 [Candidatus Roizmanbacteria bacterium RIFCSPLOWO2_02_FULL_36_11]